MISTTHLMSQPGGTWHHTNTQVKMRIQPALHTWRLSQVYLTSHQYTGENENIISTTQLMSQPCDAWHHTNTQVKMRIQPALHTWRLSQVVPDITPIHRWKWEYNQHYTPDFSVMWCLTSLKFTGENEIAISMTHLMSQPAETWSHINAQVKMRLWSAIYTWCLSSTSYCIPNTNAQNEKVEKFASYFYSYSFCHSWWTDGQMNKRIKKRSCTQKSHPKWWISDSGI